MTATFFSQLQERIPNEVMTTLIDGVLGVETELRAQVQSDIRMVQDIGEHTLEAGGKRLRPALVMLSAQATGLPYRAERCVKLGACLEMIHMATLVHDDVIDGASTRRGRATAGRVFGDTASILAGDVLLAKAMRILAVDGDLAIIRMTSDGVKEMAEGEVLELQFRNEWSMPEEEYMRVLRMKTAAYVEICCRTGAMVAGADETTTNLLGTFGHHLGMAFQIIDDLLDYTGDSQKTGKPLGTDYREGCMTLPLMRLRPHLSEAENERLARQFGEDPSTEEVTALIQLMHERGALVEARALATEHERQAMAALAALPATPQRELLSCVTEFVSGRDQ